MKTNFNFWKKVGLLCMCYWAILLWEGCGITETDSCGGQGCPAIEFPFIDYESISVTETQLTIAPGEALFLNVIARDIEYLACHQTPKKLQLGLLNSAWACSCLGNGSSGDKFPIQSINIYPNKPFKMGRPIESPLNDYFSAVTQEFTGPKATPLDEVSAANSIRLNQAMTIQGSERPDNLDESYIFTIEITKSNGEQLTVETQEIKWLP